MHFPLIGFLRQGREKQSQRAIRRFFGVAESGTGSLKVYLAQFLIGDYGIVVQLDKT